MRTMVGASSSAPTYFEPLGIPRDGYNITEVMIDGGVICNSPVLYAYILFS